jgi:hypothetical protein
MTVSERILLFCLASGTDWQAASITHATAQHTMVRGLTERDLSATQYKLTEQGRAVQRRCSTSDDGEVQFVLTHRACPLPATYLHCRHIWSMSR